MSQRPILVSIYITACLIHIIFKGHICNDIACLVSLKEEGAEIDSSIKADGFET